MNQPDLPATRRLHEQETYRLDFESPVLATRFAGDAAIEAALVESAFYVDSGGQPSDRGTLAGREVLGVVLEDGVVWHRVPRGEEADGEALAPGRVVSGHVDPSVRLDHMQQHTGQHILSQAFLRVGELPTISFHLGREDSTVDLRGTKPESQLLERVMVEANDCVLADRPIRIHRVERGELGRYPLRRDATADVDVLRLIEIEDWDWSACGGTHARRTGEVGPIQITGVERIREDWRIRFLAGRRALAFLRVAHRLLDGAARRHSVHWSAFAEVAAGWKEAAEAAEREVRRLRVERGAREGARLAVQAEPREGGLRALGVWVEGITAEELRAMAGRFVEFAPACFVGGTREGDRQTWIAACSADAPAGLPGADQLLREWFAEIGEGKGGGNERMARGTSSPSAANEAELGGRLPAWLQKRIAKGCGASD
jgi:alanyl-tRNA synthetase